MKAGAPWAERNMALLSKLAVTLGQLELDLCHTANTNRCRRILMFPSGNNVEFCSFYLEQAWPDSKPPDDWYCCVQFSIVLWNPNEPTILSHHTAHHRFTKEEGDWGFTRYLELRKVFGAQWDGTGRPMIENDAANVTAYVRVVQDETGVLWHNFQNYDSKKETGFVGLKNQGATCYLNSLIQSLYFTNAFRKVCFAQVALIRPLTYFRPSTKYPHRTKRICRTARIPFNDCSINYRHRPTQ